MKSLSKALAVALAYLETRSENCTEDDDLRAMEDAAAYLNSATQEERAAMAEAFRELSKPELIEGFGLDVLRN
ncbi:hypothetical protein [Leisingera sp. ANG-M1]|uniref:hypothetical protein n=1 Tax=Leisingera sp. ANG-M1 TaxID=1577895 RepID=UPI00126A36A0|nr:hypothetical protein [Leisingera sp. ANG-M1]